MTDLGDLRSAYEESLQGYWIRYAKVSALVGLVIVPAGITLDYMVYPDEVTTFTVTRLVFSLFIGASLAIYYTPLGKRHFREITFLWLLAAQAMICFMIYETEGPTSPYYAGLNMAVLAVGVFLPTNVYETLVFCAATLLFYLASVVSFDVHKEGFSVVYNNIFFLVLAPSHVAGQHLRILAQISRLLKNPDFRQAFLDASDSTALWSLLGSA